jgi:DNA-binding beta-propeller fold protein YncE
MSTAQAEVVVVLNSRDATVQLLDQKTYAPLSTFAVGKEPHHLMETPDGKSLIVASSVGNELIFLDPVSGQIQRRISNILDPTRSAFRRTRSGSSRTRCAWTASTCTATTART